MASKYTYYAVLFRDNFIQHNDLSGFIVYGLIDPRTKLVRYIGITQKGVQRFKEHWKDAETGSSNLHKDAWVKQLKAEGLVFEACVFDTGYSLEDVGFKEEWWIAYGKALEWPLVNMQPGGRCSRPSEEGRRRISEKARARIAEQGPYVLNEEQRELARQENLANPRGAATWGKGWKHSPEVVERLKGNQNSLGRKHSDESKAAMSAARKGVPKSEEHKAKIAAGNTGKPLAPERRAKIAASLTGRKQSEETKAKRKAAREANKRAKLEQTQSLPPKEP